MSTHPAAERSLGRFVVGVDGSAAATRAVLWAAREASAWDRPLLLVHAMDLEWPASHDPVQSILAAAKTILDEAADLVRTGFPGVPVTTSVDPERAADGVLNEAAADDVIVVGSRGLGGFSGLLLGSVSLRVAAHAKGPVVVVVRGAGPTPPKGVVVAGVRNEEDYAVLQFAAKTARRRDACLQVTCVWRLLEYIGGAVPMVTGLQGLSEPADIDVKIFEGLVEAVRREFPGLPVSEGIVRAISPAGALVEASALADLLVLGTHRSGSSLVPRLGRVTHAVLHHAHCPVAVIPCERLV